MLRSQMCCSASEAACATTRRPRRSSVHAEHVAGGRSTVAIQGGCAAVVIRRLRQSAAECGWRRNELAAYRTGVVAAALLPCNAGPGSDAAQPRRGRGSSCRCCRGRARCAASRLDRERPARARMS